MSPCHLACNDARERACRKRSAVSTRLTFGTLDSNANDRYWDVYLDRQLLAQCPATGEGAPWTMSVRSLDSWARLKLVPCADFGLFQRIWVDVPDGEGAL